MISMSNEEKNLYQNSTKNIVLEFGDGTILDNDDIYYESFSLEQMVCDDNELRFGKCIPAEMNIKIFNIPKSHIGDSVNVKITVGEYTRDFGTYYVVEDRLSDDKMIREIRAFDILYRINNMDVAEWYNSLWRYDDKGNVIPVKLKDFRDGFFEYIGVEQKEKELVNDNMLIEQTVLPSTLSGQEVIESICEINACFGQITYEGLFDYVSLQTGGSALYPSNTLYPSDYLFPKDVVDERLTESSFIQGSLTYEDYKVKKITQIQIRMEEGDIGCIYGVEGNLYTIEDNFLLFGKLENQLNQVAINFMSNLHFVEYSPVSVDTTPMPWIQPGDFIKLVNGRDSLYFPVLKREMKGIQGLFDSLEAKGTEKYEERLSGIHSDVLQLKGKSNILKRDIQETVSKITDLNTKVENEYWNITQTQSAIRQTADSIEISVENVQKQINGQVNTFYGTVVPTLDNYPANEWITDEMKMLHNGDKYYVRNAEGDITAAYRFLLTDGVFGWQSMADTDATQALQEAMRAQAQITELSSDLQITAKEIQATVGMSSTKWTTDYDITYNGYGDPINNAVIAGTNPLNKYYMNQMNGEIYRCDSYSENNIEWNKIGNAFETSDYIQSQINQSAEGIQSTVSKYLTEWDTRDYQISYSNYGLPGSFYTPSEVFNNKYYLNQQNGYVYKCERNSPGYVWNKVAELTSENVSRKEIISQINQSAEEVAINASKINLNGVVTANSNFKILPDGSMEAKNAKLSGSVTAGAASGNKTELATNGTIRTYYNNQQMMDIGYTTIDGYGGVRFNASQAAKFLALCANGSAKLVINNGYTPDGYVDSMYIFGGLQMQGHINMAYNQPIYFFSDKVNGPGTQVHSLNLGRVDGIYCFHATGSFWTERNLYYQGGVYQVSDRKVKNSIHYLGVETEKIFDNIEACIYKLNDFEEEKLRFGFIAQDVEEALEDAGFFKENMSIVGKYADSNISLNYTEMVPLLWSEVKRLKRRIEELERRYTENGSESC